MNVLLIIAMLILLNGLFVAAEFALVGAPRQLIEQLARDGDRKAASLHRLLNNPMLRDQYIATAQLGITLASLGLGMYGEHSIAVWLIAIFELSGAMEAAAAHTAASVCAITILTYAHIVLGEMVPKSIALLYAERSALTLHRPMSAARIFFFPLVICLNTLGNKMLRLFNIRVDQPVAEAIPMEELRLIVSESSREGALHGETTHLVQDLLDMTSLTAAEIMVPRIQLQAVRLGASAGELNAIVADNPRTRYPVYERDIDDIKGMVQIKTLLKLIRARAPLTLEHLRKVPFVPASALVDSMMRTMHRENSQFAVVVDEHGGTAGIVTLEDVFEEVLGRTPVNAAGRSVEDSKHAVRISGTLRVDELGEIFHMELRHPDVVTVGGLIMAELGRPPQRGDEVLFHGIKITVTALEGMGVAECEAAREPSRR